MTQRNHEREAAFEFGRKLADPDSGWLEELLGDGLQ